MEIVHLTTITPGPLVGVKVAPGVVALGLNVPVAPPVCIDHIPVPVVGALPPSEPVVLDWQMVCGPPTVAVVGGGVIVTTTSAVAFAHGAFDTVHLRVIIPAPVAWVNVAPGVVALGLNEPVAPPVTIDHKPVAPPAGLLPPRLAVVPRAQIVCGPPTVAVGCCLTVSVTSDIALAPHVAFVTVQRRVIIPGPLVGENVAFGVVAFGANVPVAPPVTIDHMPVSPIIGVLPPRPVVVPFSQTVCAPPLVDSGAGCRVIVTSAVAAVHGALETVHRNTNGDVAPVA